MLAQEIEREVSGGLGFGPLPHLQPEDTLALHHHLAKMELQKNYNPLIIRDLALLWQLSERIEGYHLDGLVEIRTAEDIAKITQITPYEERSIRYIANLFQQIGEDPEPLIEAIVSRHMEDPSKPVFVSV